MKVIITIDFSPWSPYGGGAQRSSHYLATALSRRGHETVVINTKSPFERIEVPEGLEYEHRWALFHAAKSKRNALLRPLNAFSVANAVRREIECSSGDVVVHSNGEEGGRVGRLKKNFKFGFISTPRHPHYPDELYKPSLGIVDRANLALRNGKYLMQKAAAQSADFCVPPSAFAAKLAHDALKVDEERLRVVHNGVPVEFLSYSHDFRHAASGPILFFGRFTKIKGVDVLLRAYVDSGLSTRHPLHLVGRGELRDEIVNLIKSSGLDNRVKLFDWMTHDELGDAISRCAMVVLPSLEENFSLAVLAATCVGAPTISTNVGGTPEIIIDRQTGLLVQPGSVSDLAKSLMALADSRELAQTVGQAGRERTRAHFTWAQAAQKFEGIYEESLRLQ